MADMNDVRLALGFTDANDLFVDENVDMSRVIFALVPALV